MTVTRRKLLVGGAASLITRPAIARLRYGSAAASSSGLQINLVLDTSVSSAPSGWLADIQTAAALLMAAAPQTNCTVNLKINYGVDNFGGTLPSQADSGGGTLAGSLVNYTTFKAAMIANNKTTAMNTFISSLPSGSTFRGATQYWVPSPCQKALGLIANNATVDGHADFGTAIAFGPGNVLVGVALHELSHAMGREPADLPFDALRYSSVGVYASGAYINPPAGATFMSIDGTTKIADFDTNSDPSDFLNPPDGTGVQDALLGSGHDPFDAFYDGTTLQAITTIGKVMLDCIGYQ